MSGTEWIAAVTAATDEQERRRRLDRFADEFALRPEMPVLIRQLPPRYRLPVAIRTLARLPDEHRLVVPIVDALTRGQGRLRTLQRLIDLQSRVDQCETLDEMVIAAEKRTRLRCPKCAAKRTRPSLIRHLWYRHRLIFEKGRAREPGPLVEAAIAAAIVSDRPEKLDHVYELAGVCFRHVEPIQIHQALVARTQPDPDELAPLRQRAHDQHAGLCTHCLSLVPNPIPLLPPPLVVSRGRLCGEGITLDVSPVSAQRRTALRWAWPVAVVGLLVVIFLPTQVFPPLLMAFAAMVLTAIAYCLGWARQPARTDPNDAVIDEAWRSLVPRVGRSAADVRFLTRLCRSSLAYGSPWNRTDAVWNLVEQAAVLAGKGGNHLQCFAAVRVLQAFDAGQIGQDWIPSLLGILAPLFRAEATPAYAEAVAEILLASDAMTDGDAARLRVLLAAEAFDAGLNSTDLAGLTEACPHLDRLFAGTAEWFHWLHAIWRQRRRQPWARIGEARTVFEFAANPASGSTLSAFPDTLLILRLPDDLNPGLLGRRGVTIADATLADPAADIRIEPHRDGGSLLCFGPHLIPTQRTLPKRLANTLASWLGFWEELRAAEPMADRSERLAMILAPIVAVCPLCRQRGRVKVGELSTLP